MASNQEHLFITDLRNNPEAEVRLYVDGKLVSGTYAYQVVASIDAMIESAADAKVEVAKQTETS